MIKKAAFVVSAALIALLCVVAVRTMTLKSRQMRVEPVIDSGINAQQAADRLAKSLTFETISYGVPSPISKEAMTQFHTFLETTYPQVHAALQREIIGGFSLLYTWPGSDASLDPLLIMGHFDVVPVAPDTLDQWTHPPFAGVVEDGIVWGRGAVDDKINIIGTMEAVTRLLESSYRPKRTVMLAFGHDEEATGREGAKAIAATLQDRGIRLACAVDEGGFIISGVMPGIESPVALIGIAEKGYVTLKLTANDVGGHSSTPPRHGAIGILANAVKRLEDNPFPDQIDGIPRQMLEALAPEMSLPYRAIMGNLWLTKPIVKRIMSANPKVDATLRTTTAVTTISGGIKENVLPTEASATVNHRIYPGESMASTAERVKRIINDDRVAVEIMDGSGNEPSPVSPIGGTAYKAIEKTLRQVTPDALVAPYLVLGATDARYFYSVTDNVYRIVAVRIPGDATAMVHGVNEHIAVENVGEVAAFYAQLIRNFNE
ncbi:MAG: peptidase M20 [Candidatus Hydrogenedentota bacterium]